MFWKSNANCLKKYIKLENGVPDACTFRNVIKAIDTRQLHVEQAGKVAKQAHYFIYSRKGMTASQVLETKRSHRGIENQLHWVLDMQFREDESRARADNSAENFNVLRHWA